MKMTRHSGGVTFDVVEAGRNALGFGFFMVDSRNVDIKAAPFHIESEEDIDVFAEFASATIPWVASRTSELALQ